MACQSTIVEQRKGMGQIERTPYPIIAIVNKEIPLHLQKITVIHIINNFFFFFFFFF